MDGAVAADFFTVLSTGQHYTEDQWLNMQAFSMLRAWLLHGGPGRGGADTGVRQGRAEQPVAVASNAHRTHTPHGVPSH